GWSALLFGFLGKLRGSDIGSNVSLGNVASWYLPFMKKPDGLDKTLTPTKHNPCLFKRIVT
ncbi:hypothetical protein ACJMK2_028986, partial [Sinanodonta woodiana]